ncbi:hypothetical protein AMJ44_03315 [candidate division WOR-1 bacterium DG_54_3]|uniref:ATP-grasp domain-containing protein n=1 Tax=candidate division WOR-1 bacterium DG_54_3 TaxID=1703775 RepID=A0A0S7Y4G4_UNCSA|nr:MAG: hypothetical protein AMJ44_03315 [candidate division WOR-1 bacterium DG_54_3]
MKILITDIFLRKSFDFYNIIKTRYAEYTPILLHRSASLFSRLIIRLIYSAEVCRLRKSSYEVFEEDFISVLNHFKDSKVIYIPIEEDTTDLFYEFISKNYFPNLHYNLPEKQSFDTTRDKKVISEFCRRYNISVPQEYTKESIKQLEKKFKPIVAKPRTGSGAAGIIFVDEPGQLDRLDKIDFNRYIVQEKIPNTKHVQGAFFLFHKGKYISYYGHRRLRTFPLSGGVTVYSEFNHDERIKNIGTILLEKLNWSGFVMIEFLYDEDADTYKIIEINPRLWGSFILSEFSETGFLKNYLNSSLGNPVSRSNIVRENVYIRWFFPFDLINYVTSLGRIKNFWKFDLKNTCYINFTYSNIFRSFMAMPLIYSTYIKQLFYNFFGLRKT